MVSLEFHQFAGDSSDPLIISPWSQKFSQRMSGREAGDYLIRVNRQPVARDYVLQDGDRVSITPTKIQGAVAA